jgi:dihydrofolate reductase
MPKLTVFNQITLDGYFTGANGDMSWAYKDASDAEWNAFVSENAKGGGMLIFGRKTYDMMASYWPTPMAMQRNPVVAERMNAMPKIVISRRMDKPAWANTMLIKSDLPDEIRKLKAGSGPDMAILGSGSIVKQLAEEGLIDVYQIVMCPLALGAGRTLFEGVNKPIKLKLTDTRAFANGSVVLSYIPAA